jgi:Xaa-Pro aminopeptidase
MSWPAPSEASCFVERRRRLASRYRKPAVFASGIARVRNMQSSYYPFRAESHFLYLVGRALEGALLWIHEDQSILYVTPPDPGDDLWLGPEPSLEQLSDLCGLPVQPISEFEARDDVADIATLPPQDTDTADWLSELLDRDIVAGSGHKLVELDAELADAMIETRLRHDEAALSQMRQAAELTELAHRAGMGATRPGLFEAAIRAAMEARITAGGMCPAYQSIVTVHGEVLHSERYDNRLAPGDLLLADVGAETPEGWASDVTRTWPVAGRFDGPGRALYEVVLAAQKAAIEQVKPSVRYLDVHLAASRALLRGLVALGIFSGDVEELLEAGAVGVFFPHGVGHLLGLDVHDLDDLGDRATYAAGRTRSTQPGLRFLRLDRDLEPNMVVTVEPGFYQVPTILNDTATLAPVAKSLNRNELEKYRSVRGIRIEDDVLVTETGNQVLTASIPKEIREIESLVGLDA